MRPKRIGATRHLLRRFKKDRKGGTAVEFAAILLPFLLLTLGTLEISLIHLSRSAMTDAVEKTSRQIMTGQAGCIDAQEYVEQLCARLSFSNGECTSNTKVFVEELAAFSQTPGDLEQDFDAIPGFGVIDSGRENSVMLLRSLHRWNVMIPLLDQALGGGDGEIILESNLAFRNEPFGASNGCIPSATPPAASTPGG